MLGFLEPNHQAMLTIELDQGPLDFLIDTGFDGTLIIGEELIDTSNLIPLGTIVAELASHQTFSYPRFAICITWFGEDLLTDVLVGPGKECLIGTALLNPHCLVVDYSKRVVELICSPDWK